jgi:hypothetical protein
MLLRTDAGALTSGELTQKALRSRAAALELRIPREPRCAAARDAVAFVTLQ